MKKFAIMCIPLIVSTGVYAQSSITLFGVIDEGIGFTSNAGGQRAWQMQSGWAAGDRWGLTGTEDMGGGNKAIFTLENGFDLNSGTLGQAGRIFGRQAFVGLQNDEFGALMFGRQYDSVVDYLGPLTANGSLAGWSFAHPYDNDETDNTFRLNNAVKYASPNYSGFRFGGVYSFSNQAGGFADNRAYSLGVSYVGAGLQAAAVYLQANNPGANSSGGLATDDSTFTANRQRIWGGGINYTWQSATVGFVYTHTSLDNPTASIYFGELPSPVASLRFNNFEFNAHYRFTPTLFVLAMYTYTDGHVGTTSGNSSPKWHQGGLMVDYNISKRTDVYTQVIYQHTSGGPTGTVLDNAYINGAAGISSGNSQVLARVGIKHFF